MAYSTQDEAKRLVIQLLQKATIEAQDYNWDEAIKLLKKAEKKCEDNELESIKGEVYFRFGETYFQR